MKMNDDQNPMDENKEVALDAEEVGEATAEEVKVEEAELAQEDEQAEVASVIEEEENATPQFIDSSEKAKTDDESVEYVQDPNKEYKDKAQDFLQLDSLIKKYLKDIAELKVKISEQRSMYNDSFTNDAAYHTAEEKAKEVAKAKKEAKDKITKLTANLQVEANMRDLKDRMKSAQEMLSGYLERYVTQTGARTIEDEDGNLLQIVPDYKLKRKME